MPPAAKPVTDRILASIAIDEATGCWNWKLHIFPTGYGCIRVQQKTLLAHRASFEAFTGRDLLPGMHIDHLCRNRACVNPAHLEQVTPRVNTLRGMSRQAKADITHCPHGHEYDEKNTYVWHGRRFCRACNRVAVKRRNQRRKEAVA